MTAAGPISTRYSAAAKAVPGACFHAFDLLALDGVDLRHLPFSERYAKLDAMEPAEGSPILRAALHDSLLPMSNSSRMQLTATIRHVPAPHLTCCRRFRLARSPPPSYHPGVADSASATPAIASLSAALTGHAERGELL